MPSYLASTFDPIDQLTLTHRVCRSYRCFALSDLMRTEGAPEIRTVC